MEVIPESLSRASSGALASLTSAARLVARTSADERPERAMSGAARGAIFADALLAAVHARLEELKSVAK